MAGLSLGDVLCVPDAERLSKERRACGRTRRLAAVGSIWTLASWRSSPGARRHFDARRAAGDWNRQAPRHLFNKLLGQLHHCLHTGQLYNEHLAFPPPPALSA